MEGCSKCCARNQYTVNGKAASHFFFLCSQDIWT